MEVFKTNRDIYNRLKFIGEKSDYRSIVHIILENINFPLSTNCINQLEEKLRLFTIHLKQRWEKSSRNEQKFLQKYEDWLNLDFNLTELLSCDDEICESSVKEKPFHDCSERHQMRRTEDLRNSFSAEELMFAAKMNYRKEGNTDMADVLGFLIKNQHAVSKLKKACEEISTPPETYTKEQALSLATKLNLSTAKYNALRKFTEKDGYHIFPSYYKIQKARKDCYPDDKHILVTEMEAKIDLQALLDITVKRLILTLPHIQTNSQGNDMKFTLISKWGCDGSSGQSIYKQKFTDDRDIDESSCFLTSLVPIKLYNESLVVWENSKPSSTLFCRPIRFAFCKESTDAIKNEVQRVESEISLLQPTRISSVSVKHQLLMTMVDGKICNAITETSSAMRCYICGATPKTMNDLESIKKRASKEEFYNFGISSLHAKIRSFECLLHMSYNLDFKKWSAKTSECRELQQNRKKEIQEKFRKELGIYVDRIKQGVGTHNDGNTARKFFEDSNITAEITGLDEQLIRRFAVLLQALSSNKAIDARKFGLFAKETAELYVSKYSWYYMPVTVHKILIHGEDIIKNALVPIGQLSEEAQEARNKDFRKFRETRSRKINRKSTNEDILNNLLISSDPLITHLRRDNAERGANSEIMLPEVKSLLIYDTLDNDISDCDTNTEDERMEED